MTSSLMDLIVVEKFQFEDTTQWWQGEWEGKYI